MTTCDLCGLDCGRKPIEQAVAGVARRFCCAGCLNVYTILHESGLVQPGVDLRDTELFKRSLALGLVSAADQRSRREQVLRIPEDAPTKEIVLHVSGMWCASCAWLIEHALAAEPGVRSVEVLFASDLLKLRYCPQYLPPDRIAERVSRLGYSVSEYTGESDRAEAERRDLWLRLGVATFLWVNVMMLNLAIYVGYFEEIPASVRRYLPWLLMALSAPAVFYSAWPIHRLAWGGLRAGIIRMETLLASGTLAAWGYSVVEAWRGGDHIYFDTACAIVTFVLLGKTIERGARESAARAIAVMHRMMPAKARVLADGGVERFVAADAVQPGERVLVKAGERIPVDGIVVSGRSQVDESLLTGEAAPRGKGPGSAVAGGSVNIESALEICASRTSADSALSHIVRMVERALSARSRLERAVDRVSRVFVPAVVCLALATFGGWWIVGGISAGDALLRGVTVLVIACPCALGIATPLAVIAAVGAASRRGILVGHGNVLETIRRVDCVVLDKTGTVTEGVFALIGMEAAGEPEPVPLDALAALEAYSEHPLGKAVVRAAQQRALALPAAADVEILKGVGLTGRVGNRLFTVGSRRAFRAIDAGLESRAEEQESQGHTVAFYGSPQKAEGLLVFGDRVSANAMTLVSALRRRGIRTLLVSGDAWLTVECVAAKLGVDEAHANASPEQKVRIVDEARARGHVVAMVGDGINDAPALARADLGIAMASGTDLAMKAAALVLMNNDVTKLLEVLDLGRRTFSIVRQNLFWAFFYNTLGLGLAVAGLLNPIVAAGGMVLSSASVVANSSRLARDANRQSHRAMRLRLALERFRHATQH